jgi:RimJ/RimL family protein N-acetyltransferase
MTPFAELRLETPRLLLRPLQPGDADEVFGIFSDPAVMRYWSTPCWAERAQAAQMIEDDTAGLAGRRDLRLGLVLRATQRVVGTVSLFRIDAGCRRAEVGYALARAAQGQGLMDEAMRCLVDAAFDHRAGAPFDDLLLHRLEADADPRNAPSCRCLERLGFTREGLLRERWRVGDEVSDSALYGLLRPDWPPRTPPRT